MSTDTKTRSYYTRLMAANRRVARLERELAEARLVRDGLAGRVRALSRAALRGD